MPEERANDLMGQGQDPNQPGREAPSRDDPAVGDPSGAAGKPDDGGLTDEDIDMFEDDPNIPTE
ncbi:hypothetical protein [Stutzerimonas azotifigens]|uniref:hypothetical protein n=1 Tax=Stutzerimonas azotifigens TaxID=291995 RepID=UPI000488742D|nr:hypothetical protein [Stutzerimonas azotifigens]